jgi:hypothetical protein
MAFFLPSALEIKTILSWENKVIGFSLTNTSPLIVLIIPLL